MNAAWISGKVADLAPLGDLPNGGHFLNFTIIDESRPQSPTTIKVSVYNAEAVAASKIIRNNVTAHVMGELRSRTATGRVTLFARQIAVGDAS
jgi:hypothetical protein